MRNGIFLTLFIFLGAFGASIGQSLPDYLPKDSLIGWWPFSGNEVENIGVRNRALTRKEISNLYTGRTGIDCEDKNVLNPALNYNTVSDNDGNIYATVKIGQLEWLAENLRTTRYSNGDLIPEVKNSMDWEGLNFGAWCYWNNDSTYNCPFGKLYNYYTVNDQRNICPSGWHVPTPADWHILSSGLGGNGVSGGKMKSAGTIQDGDGYWNFPNNFATNESGFSAIPGGDRWPTGGFYNKDFYTLMWTKTDQGGTFRDIDNAGGDLFANGTGLNAGLTVRCIRDMSDKFCNQLIFNEKRNYGTVSDIDGNSYRTIQAGKQIWLAENLRTTKYSNGDKIPEVKGNAEWSELSTGAWCFMGNDPGWGCPYGKLYNYFTISDARNICPDGWHVPTADDWQILSNTLGGNADAGGKMKSTGTWEDNNGYWNSPNNFATNSSGLSIVPGGDRWPSGSFYNHGYYSIMWIKSDQGGTFRDIDNAGGDLFTNGTSLQSGLTIRCISNEEASSTSAMISTQPISDITSISATSGAIINSDGGSIIDNRGLVWGTTPNPTIVLPTKTSEGNGVGEFTSKITGLLPGTKYYIRAYATNDAGTAYGNELIFTTRGVCLPEYVPTDGLVSYWPFCGNANDESGNENHGTVNGAILTADRFGEPDKAYSFNGESDYIKTDKTNLLPTGNASRTVSYWINSNSLQENMTVLGYGNNTEFEDFHIWHNWRCPGVGINISNAARIFSTNTIVNQWNHFTVVFDNSSNSTVDNIKIYLNGTLLTTACAKFSNGLLNTGNEFPVFIGRYHADNLHYFKGTLDDIGIWNRVLTEEEIKQLYLGDSKEITIKCDKAILHGILQQGVSADGMNVSIPYTNGDGSQYAELSLNSEGVSGLTATLQAGNFAVGNGLLTFALSGTPEAEGKARFNLDLAGQNCTFDIDVVKSAYPAGTVFCSGTPTAVVDVTNPKTGKTWMDRNLGAGQVATSQMDTESYGDLYQWGRKADGHQCKNSDVTNILSLTDQPSNDDFIIAPDWPQNWLNPKNNNLWQGIIGANNPCPVGYRPPTIAEYSAEVSSWEFQNAIGAFNSGLKMPLSGSRDRSFASLEGLERYGHYWSSTFDDTSALYLNYENSFTAYHIVGRAHGCTIRCIKENSASIGSIDCSGYETIGTLTDGVQSSGVSLVVPYQQGNGGFYPEQTFTSSGVTGLTASLSSGILAEGTGNLTLQITGISQGSGAAEFNITISGVSCKLSVQVLPNTNTSLFTLSLDTLTGRRDDVVVLPVRVKNFTDILSGQLSLTFDPAIITLAGVENFGTDSITEASFNLNEAASGRLSFLWTQNDNIPISLSDGDTLFAMRFKVLGRNTEFTDVRFTTSPLGVEFVDTSLKAIDNIVLQNGRINAFSENVLSGQLRTETGQGIRSATLAASGGSNASTSSALSGQYALTLPELTSIKVTPAKDNDTVVTNGITITDVIRMQRHILGSVPLESPYKIIAADINQSGTITGLDVVLVNALILGRLSTYPGGKLWSFVPTSHTFVNPQQPFPYPNYRSYTDFSGSVDADFIGMKLGDVDNSYIPSQGRNPSADTVTIYTEDQQVPTGAAEVRVPVRVSDFESISGFQFGVQWDPAVLKYKGAEKAAAMSAADLGTDHTENGHLNVAWFHPTGLWTTLSNGAAIMELIFETVGAPGSASTVGVYDSPTTPVEIIQDDLSPAGAKINTGIIALGTPSSAQDAESDGVEVSMYPNPFSNELYIEIQSALISETGMLSVYDETGRQVYHEEVRIEKGESRHTTGAGLPAGSYTLRLEDRDGRIIKQQKAIKIR